MGLVVYLIVQDFFGIFLILITLRRNTLIGLIVTWYDAFKSELHADEQSVSVIFAQRFSEYLRFGTVVCCAP